MVFLTYISSLKTDNYLIKLSSGKKATKKGGTYLVDKK